MSEKVLKLKQHDLGELIAPKGVVKHVNGHLCEVVSYASDVKIWTLRSIYTHEIIEAKVADIAGVLVEAEPPIT